MEKAIIGKKIGMTQIFDEAGRVIPVTLIQAGPCTVVQKKTAERDGYESVQLGFNTVPERKLTKPEAGHQKKAGLTELKKVLKEFTLKDCSKYEVGDELTANVFAAGDFVDVTGTSKGHGFQGVVKRHGAAVKRNTHGGGPVHRHQGSLGAGTTPGHIAKGRDGAGQMGNVQITVQNLDVVQVDEELGLIAVRGAIPGPKGGVVFVKSTVKTHVEKKASEAGRVNPQKASARVNPQKASARSK
ncbi:50S ribosomal protein L3 [Oscillospiraceae bacterium 50-16]